jgi:hypothetical protein
MLKFHPEPGTILIRDYTTGFREPEMVKRRPIVTISPRLKRRDGLITVDHQPRSALQRDRLRAVFLFVWLGRSI